MEYNTKILEKVKNLSLECDEINLLLSYNEVQADIQYFKSLLKRKTEIEKIVCSYKKFLDLKSNLENNIILRNNEQDKQLIEFYDEEILCLKNQINNEYLIMQYLLMDNNLSNANLEINTINSDMLEIFVKMYTLYAKNNFLNVNIEYKSDCQANLVIEGNLAYERFKLESGKHLVKDNKFNTTELDVYCYKNQECTFDFEEKDIKIDIFRASGAGGQNVNKVETAVRVTHLKTNISVTCQDERSQRQNKERAIYNLKNKVKAYYKALIDKDNNLIKKQSKSIIRTYDFNSNSVTQNGKNAELNNVLAGNLNVFNDEILLLGENE